MSLLNDLVSEKGVKIIDNDNSICIVEATGEVEEVENLIKQLKQFEILEIMRSGKVAMVKVDQDEHRVEIEEKKKQKSWATQQISDALY
jgi:acetolactate synthase-1/3 small subunit